MCSRTRVPPNFELGNSSTDSVLLLSTFELCSDLRPRSDHCVPTLSKLGRKGIVRNAYDENSVHALMTEVFNFPRSFAPLPEVVASALRERIARAEIRYMTGQSSGVQESDIVLALNTLAARFQTPDYAHTSLKQVRVLRMNLLLTTPVFMGKGMVRETHNPANQSTLQCLRCRQHTCWNL